jgi:hypothetical protein
LKKTTVIALVFGILISCGNNQTVSEIDNFVSTINNRNDLTESITEFNTEDLSDVIIGGISIYKLTDKSGEIFRIIAEIGELNELPLNYEFYFQKDTLSFARIIKFNETGNDTLMISEYYFRGSELIKQNGKETNKIEAETVRKTSVFYLVYGKEASE